MVVKIEVPYVPVIDGAPPSRVDVRLSEREGAILLSVREATGSQTHADALRSLIRLVGAAAHHPPVVSGL